MFFRGINKEKDRLKYLIIAYILPSLLLIIVGLWFIEKNTMIKIVGDEYGYWAAGAYISGLDWSEITSYNSYYGYGYGIILAALLKLHMSSIITYRLALFLNIIFIIGIYVIVYHMLNKFTVRYKISIIVKVLLALFVSTYSGNLSYTQYTMPEVLIAFIYWILIFLAYRLLNKLTVYDSILFILLNIYLFSVHQRTIGICLISCFFWIYIVVKNKDKRRIIILSVLLGCLAILAVLWFKNNYQIAFFDGGQGKNLSVNDFAGQTSKFEALMSVNGIWMFIKSFAGKIYYLLSSSYMLAGISALFIITKYLSIFCRHFKTKVNETTVFYLYILLNTVIMVGISSLSMMEYYGRFDMLFYGRYFEFTIAPLMLLGLIFIIYEECCYKKIIVCLTVICYLILTCSMEYIIDYGRSTSNVFINCSGIADLLIFQNYRKFSLLFIAIRSCLWLALLFIIIYIAKSRKKLYPYTLILVLSVIVNITSYCYVYKEGCLSWSVEQSNREVELAEFIQNIGASDSLHYYIVENDVKADYLQFLLKDHTIHIFEYENEIYRLNDSDYILTTLDTSLRKSLYSLGYKEYANSETLILWGKG